MARDDAKLLELKQVAQELDRRATRLDADEAQAIADRDAAIAAVQDLAIQRQVIAEQRANYDRVVRIYSDEKPVSTRGR